MNSAGKEKKAVLAQHVRLLRKQLKGVQKGEKIAMQGYTGIQYRMKKEGKVEFLHFFSFIGSLPDSFHELVTVDRTDFIRRFKRKVRWENVKYNYSLTSYDEPYIRHKIRWTTRKNCWLTREKSRKRRIHDRFGEVFHVKTNDMGELPVVRCGPIPQGRVSSLQHLALLRACDNTRFMENPRDEIEKLKKLCKRINVSWK